MIFNNQALQEPDYDQILQKQDFFPKIFLIPSEIKLHKDYGLMAIQRNQSHPDKFEQQEILPITIDEKQIKNFNQDPSSSKHPAGHGLLSLFKRTTIRRIKLAICICVYSEPKHMLKSTIKGIQDSYSSFFERAGIMPHEIIMIVIFDGIEKINNDHDQTSNMISFFNEIDIKNGFTFKPYGKTLKEYIKDLEQKNFKFNDIDQTADQISLFTEEELCHLRTKLFQHQYHEYNRIKQLLKDIKDLKKLKEIKIDSLPNDVLKKYEELCNNYCVESNLWYETQEQIQEYLSFKKNIKIKLIYEALHETELLCMRYLQSRQDKSILYPARLDSNALKNPRDTDNGDQLLEEQSIKSFNYIFFCVKHKNQGKLSSHMLFFEGFCKLFDPQYCILTDVGVKPQKNAIYKMWAHMQKNPKVGGVCGYMGLQLENPSDDLGYRDDGYNEDQLNCLTTKCDWLFTVQRAQQFEYHFAHMLDKPFQSAFGYIHVLPGAFSGYRFKALKSIPYKGQQSYSGLQSQRQTKYSEGSSSEEESEALMKRYLKTAISRNTSISLEDSNMYLAEDRVMCLGIHALGYDLAYLPDAESCVDPVTSLTKLLGQRRRWLNGSWFAFNYVRQHSNESSSCLFWIQLRYFSLVQKLQWIQISLFYLAMNLTLIAAAREYAVPAVSRFFLAKQDYELYNYKVSIFNVRNVIDSLPDVINFIYVVLLFTNLFYSCLVNNNNSRYKPIYYLSSTVFGVYGLLVFALLIANTVDIIADMLNGVDKEEFIVPIFWLRALILFIIVGHVLPILWTFSFKKYVQMLTSLLSYVYYAPTYVNLVQIFAFARIDDLSWGTKGLDMSEADSTQRQWQRKKYIFILQFVSSNVVLSYVLIKLSEYDFLRNVLIFISACLVAFLLSFRLVFALVWMIKYTMSRPWKKFTPAYVNENRSNGNRILSALNNIQNKIKQIEKEKTRRKKEDQYKRIAMATSQILSRNLSSIGKKLRSQLAHHLVSNNIIPKKQLDPKRKFRNKKKITLKKNLNTVDQIANEENQGNDPKESHFRSQSNKTPTKHKNQQQNNYYNIVVPEMPNSNKIGIKARIEAIKEKKARNAEKQN